MFVWLPDSCWDLHLIAGNAEPYFEARLYAMVQKAYNKLSTEDRSGVHVDHRTSGLLVHQLCAVREESML